MNKLLSIKEASKLLGVSESTLRRWEREKKLIPDERTKGNQRRYKLSSLRPLTPLKSDFDKREIIKHVIGLVESLDIKDEILEILNDSTQD